MSDWPSGNRTFRPFDVSPPGRFAPSLDVSPLHWTFRPLDVSPPGRFATRTFRPLDVSPLGRFAPRTFRPCTFRYLDVSPPTVDVSPRLLFYVFVVFFRTPERDGRVDRQNFYQYLASVWIKMKTKIITARFPRTRTEKCWLLCH